MILFVVMLWGCMGVDSIVLYCLENFSLKKMLYVESMTAPFIVDVVSIVGVMKLV